MTLFTITLFFFCPVSGTAGLLASLLRVVTKLVVADIRLNTVLFFVVIVVFLVVCCLTFILTVRTDFVQFYVQLYAAALQKEEDDRSSFDCGGGTDEVGLQSYMYIAPMR